MRILLAFVIMAITAAEGTAFRNASVNAADSSPQRVMLAGKWRVRFNFPGVGDKNLVFESQAKGSGTFLLLDTEPGNKPAATSLPAVWTQTTNDRVNFAGEVELPYGTCCREVGTLIFNGKFGSSDSISGKAIMITSTVEEENCIGFRSMVGTFSAVRVTNER